VAKKPIFVREATGLVREIGFLLGAIIIVAHTVGLGWQKRIFQFSNLPIPTNEMWGGLPPMFWAFLLGGILIIVTGAVVGLITAAMPRSGGGYVSISRTLHPFAGYMAAWLEFLAEAFSYGIIAVACFEAIMIFYGIVGIPVTFDATQLLVGGIILTIIFSTLGCLGVRMYGRLLHAIFWVPVGITVFFFAMWIHGSMNPGVVAQAINTVMGAPPEVFVSIALDAGMATAYVGTFFDAVSWALLGAFWAYIGYYAVTFVAGEVKEAHIKTPKIIVVAGVSMVLLYLATSACTYFSTVNVGVTTVNGDEWSFFQAYSYLSYTDEGKAAVEAALDAGTITAFHDAWSTGVASMIATGMGMGWISWLIALAAMLWVMNDIPPFLLVCSRTVFAMAFDRMLPEKFAYVSERWHAPIYAILLTTVFAFVGAGAEAGFVGAWAGVIGADIYDALFLTLFCLSAALLPIRRKDIYERATVKLTPAIYSLAGLAGCLMAAWVLYLFIGVSWADMSAPENAGPIAVLILIGILLYVGYWIKNAKKGIDMRTLYLSIPPE
jgi:amino acid transporter